MSKKPELLLQNLPRKYQNIKLTTPKDGSSGRVFFAGDGVLKIFDEVEYQQELKLNQKLINANLRVPRVLESFPLGKSWGVIFERVQGKSSKGIQELEKICDFVDTLHSKNFKVERDIFARNSLENLIKTHNVNPLKNIIGELECNPKALHLIHGDLFPDNAKFLNGELQGVFDWEFASMGDRRFEYAIIAISWCKSEKNLFEREALELVLERVGGDFSDFLEYIKYALAFYATIRFIDNRNYQELLNFYFKLKEFEW